MTPNALAILAVAVLPLVLGLGVARQAGPRGDPLALVAWAQVVGLLATAAVVGAWLAIGLPASRAGAIAVPLGLGAILLLANRRRRPPLPQAPAPQRRERAFAWAVLAVLALALVDEIALFDLGPVVASDEAWIWTLRAKFLWQEWVLDTPTPTGWRDLRGLQHADYPLLAPLVALWSYLVSGGITHVLVRLPFQLAFVASCLYGTRLLLAVLRPWVVAVMVPLWLPSQLAALIVLGAQCEAIVGAAVLFALESWRAFANDGSRHSLRWFATSLCLLVWTKHEGSMLALAIAMGCAAHLLVDRTLRARLRERTGSLAWLALPFAFVAATWIVNAHEGFANDLLGDNAQGRSLPTLFVQQFASRALPVADFLARYVTFAFDPFRLLWVAFFAVVVLLPRRAFAAPGIAATVALLAAFAGYACVFVGTFHPLEWHLGTAGLRVYYHLFPALIVWVGRALADLWPALARTGPDAAFLPPAADASLAR